MRIRLSKSAQRDLDGIFVYWAQRAGIDSADRLVDSITGRFAILGEFPNAGRLCHEIEEGVRCAPAGSYLVYYRKARGQVEVLHVFHGARNQRRAWNSKLKSS